MKNIIRTLHSNRICLMKVVITICIVLAASALLLSANKFLPKLHLGFHSQPFINGILQYQLFAFLVAICVLIVTLIITPESKELLKFGNMDSLAVKESWLGINGTSSWKKNGIQLAIFISMATGIFMFLALKYTSSLQNFNMAFLPIIILISLTNSFSEEVIYRFAINGNLLIATSKLTILLISAILFGLPHFQGYPNGVTGVIMAGLLGYILSKATFETQGLGIAWAIHFIQDVIIFSALFMMNLKS